MIFDTCMVNQELDMAECRLRELEAVPGLVHVFVEADVDHQDHPKPFHFTESLADGRFDQWKDRLRIIRATNLPTARDFPDPWAREHAQREWATQGLKDASPSDVVLHGDLDEIPTAVAVRNVRPRGFVAFRQRFHCFAVDWLHPEPWRGTVAARASIIDGFGAMRDLRNYAQPIPAAGWHFSWVGTPDYPLDKLGSFCHPEIADRTLEGLKANVFLTEGWHVDGQKLTPVEVDGSWPKWVAARECPESWFRPR